VIVRARVPARWCDPPFGLDVAPDGSRVYACLEAADHPEEIWQFGAGFEGPRRLLPLNPDLGDVALGTARLVEWRAPEGERRRGLLLLPPGYAGGRPLPLVVEVYLGRMGSQMRHRFGGFAGVVHAQLLAARGYAVLWPDMPAVARDPLRHLPGRVLPAIDRLIELGIADPDRLGVLGQSYGGYCVQALIAQTGRFKAAVASAGATNLTSMYGALGTNGQSLWLGWLEGGQGRAGGALWERRDAYIENSPLFYLDRVTTPLLLISGGAHAEEPAQAGEAFSALRRLGKRVELRIYRGEGHAPILWSEANYRDVCERVLAWFDEHLGDGGAGTGGRGTGADGTA
jgi:dipeptidyl aminopeptidase/acylaminoacyl peptidase